MNSRVFLRSLGSLLLIHISLVISFAAELESKPQDDARPNIPQKTIRAAANGSDGRELEFKVFWPPKDPSETPSKSAQALLNGRVVLRLDRLANKESAMHLRIILNRPADEAGREFWNSSLAFPEYDWMRYVRVW